MSEPIRFDDVWQRQTDNGGANAQASEAVKDLCRTWFALGIVSAVGAAQSECDSGRHNRDGQWAIQAAISAINENKPSQATGGPQ